MAPNRNYQDIEGAIPRNDAYTGLLAISFFAMFIACLLLFVDWYSYHGLTPPKTRDFLPAVKGGGAPAPAPAGKAVDKEPAKKEEPKAKDDGKEKAEKKDDGKEKMEKKDDAKKDDAKDKAEKKE